MRTAKRRFSHREKNTIAGGLPVSSPSGLRHGDAVFGRVTASASLGGQRSCTADMCNLAGRPVPKCLAL
jgi:hypothetical protein